MKTTILAGGTLSITPESDLEAYALNRWAQDNITGDWCNVTVQAPKIIIDLSEYAEQMGLSIVMGATPA